jgi:hypothetical protein
LCIVYDHRSHFFLLSVAPGLHLRIRHQSQQLVRLVELVVGEEEVRLVPLSHTVVGELQMEALEVVVVGEEYEVRWVPLSHTVVG